VAPPGVVVAHSPAASGIYLASPGIVELPGGDLLVKCDEHGPGSTEKVSGRTRLFRSADRGATWRPVSVVDGMYWATLFTAKGALWLLGTERQDGPIVLRRSDDEGTTWTAAKGPRSGRLFDDARYHGAPTPALIAKERIWRGFERVGPGGWGKCFEAFLLSAPLDADWLDARHWRRTNAHGFDPALLGGRFGGWCEGNAVEGPGGVVHDLLRVHVQDLPEHAGVLKAGDVGTTLAGPGEDSFPAFPGGCKKFTVRRHPKDGHWWTLANVADRRRADVTIERTRNVVALVRSVDFRNWETRAILLSHPDVHRHGMQYVDWIFSGDDMLAVARTAWDDAHGGARSQHDANHITFHRVERFRTLRDRPVAAVQGGGRV